MACGVLAVVSKDPKRDLRTEAMVGLQALNHRGEQSHGIAFLEEDGRISVRKGLGLVNGSALPPRGINRIVIGHTRYLTSSTNNIENAQPLLFEGELPYALSHNGNIDNDQQLKKEMGTYKNGISDTHVLGELIGSSLRKSGREMIESLRKDLPRAVGSYSLVALIGGEEPRVIVMRDRFGYMPICMGENEYGFFVASETVALDQNYLGATPSSIRPVNPGELITITSGGTRIDKLFEPEPRLCMFQLVYMCRPDSVVEGSPVSRVRREIGRILGMRGNANVDFVIPVPDSGSAAAFGYSETSGKPILQGLTRDRYTVGRSFMQNSARERDATLSIKHTVNRAEVQGKKVMLVDDSIVRGSTMRRIIERLRDAGTAEVHVAVSCPPIISQCPFGIDFYNEQLVARPFRDEEHERICISVANQIRADSLVYPTIPELVRATGLEGRLCMSCLTGKYDQNVTFESEEERKRPKVQIS